MNKRAAVRLDRPHTTLTEILATGFPRCVNLNVGILVIVQSCASQLRMVKRETQRFNQMKIGTGIGAQTNDVARIRRNLGMDEDNRKHQRGSDENGVM